MLNVTQSNRFEVLLRALLLRLDEKPGSPFHADQIIVPSAAIRRKVTLAAADRFGVFANAEFSYLAQWLWRQIRRIVPVGQESPFAPPVLAWRVHCILEDGDFVRAHPRLTAYLAQADDVMRHDLACRIAARLDEYVAYRPDWLEAWSAGADDIPDRSDRLELTRSAREDCRWQAALWRRIVDEIGLTGRHPAEEFIRKLGETGTDAAGHDWPGRAHLFCLPTMPPQYIRILSQLGSRVELHLYVLNPCSDFWYDIVDRKQMSNLVAGGKADYHEVGNRLLASWGKQTQAQLALLHAETPFASAHEFFVPAAGDNPSLLARVQDAILYRRELEPEEIFLAEGDRSIEVHVCHSLTRELEVLHDQLLALFAGDEAPKPEEILVVTPDLERAAPLIDAVFGHLGEHSTGTPRIPYVISGRGGSKVNPAARALLDLLGLVTSRFDALSVFNLLRQPLVARRFRVEGALDAIHDWLAQSGIRWGLDAGHRESLGLPGSGSHSFEDGLHRLFMGFALPSSVSEPFNGRLPAASPEGSDAMALGSLWQFVRSLDALRTRLAGPLPADHWMPVLFEAMDAFMLPAGDELDDMEEVRGGMCELHAGMAAGCGPHPVSLGVIRSALAAALDNPPHGGVPSGSVTFSSMSSLRNLPYRFICAIGLNDGVFPADPRPVEFDMMQHAPRLGDRQRRSDDRNLFLDLLLAARERLYLSYTGRSVRDNSPMPPSVLVAELLDCLAPLREQLVVLHPLQAFSIDYFKVDANERLVNFNRDYRQALQRLATSVQPPNASLSHSISVDDDDDGDEVPESADPFFTQPLPEPGEEFRTVALADLCSFFSNPCRHLLRQRLGIVFSDEEQELAQDEPFVADGRARRQLADRVLPLFLDGRDWDAIRACARAGVEYPSGILGDMQLEQELKAIEGFAHGLAADLQGEPLPPLRATLDFDLDGESWRLQGGFGDLRATGLVRYRYDTTWADNYLTGWIEHLFLNAAAKAGTALHTVWHSLDGSYRLPPVDQAMQHLRELLLLYREGLQRPLRFFPSSAWQFKRKGMGDAEKAWHRNFRGRGESLDPAYRLALRGVPVPLDGEFERAAETVFGPLLLHIVDERLEQ